MERKIKPQIIGGMFGLAETSTFNKVKPSFLNDRNLLLANARSGIWVLIDLLSPPQVWMPSYLCGTMLQAVEMEVTTVRFYEIDSHLKIPSLEWLNEVQANDLVVVIDYFGFPCDRSCVKAAQERGAWVLEDASQALLSEDVGQFADYVLFSPRKFLGVPDGGILSFNHIKHSIELDRIQLTTPPESWWLKAFTASVLRREFDHHDGSRSWFKLFQEANAECPIGPYAMSELSQMLLRHCLDCSMIAQKRVENYQVLAKLLVDLAIFPTLPPKVVPLGFPVRVKNRDKVRQILFDRQIYPPVHWQIQQIVPKKFRDSHQLADEIMTLPCDQRYDIQEVEWMAQLLKRALKC